MQKKAKDLKYLWVYSAADEWIVSWHNKLISRRRNLGYDIEGFCITPQEFNRRWIAFPHLDKLWRLGDERLMKMYSQLADRLQGKDVLILYNGANMHPEFVKTLDVIKIYSAGDDPESTDVLTKPVAPAFDIHLVNNIACVDMYKSWGLKRVHFWPLGSFVFLEDNSFNEDELYDVNQRNVPIVFFGEYQELRKDRLKKLYDNFPDGYFAGKGWPRGYVNWDHVFNVYKRSQIGWNLHLSTGPINFRTYELPAYGVLQLCDNKSHLGEIFKLNEEVVGYDSIEECIELTKYYLNNVEEQRKIAVAGWERWKMDYHPDKVWEKLIDILNLYLHEFNDLSAYQKEIAVNLLNTQRRKTFLDRNYLKYLNQIKLFIKQLINYNYKS